MTKKSKRCNSKEFSPGTSCLRIVDGKYVRYKTQVLPFTNRFIHFRVIIFYWIKCFSLVPIKQTSDEVDIIEQNLLKLHPNKRTTEDQNHVYVAVLLISVIVKLLCFWLSEFNRIGSNFLLLSLIMVNFTYHVKEITPFYQSWIEAK